MGAVDTEWIFIQCRWQSGRYTIEYYLESIDGSGGQLIDIHIVQTKVRWVSCGILC